LIKRTIWLKGY